MKLAWRLMAVGAGLDCLVSAFIGIADNDWNKIDIAILYMFVSFLGWNEANKA